MADFFDKSKSLLKDDEIFVVDTFSGKSKASGKDFFKISFICLNRSGDNSYLTDKFVDKSIYNQVLGFGYYRVKTGGIHGDWVSLTPVKVISI